VDELHIPAGLQDRVIQVYEGLVFMDFAQEIMRKQGYGRYEPLEPKLLPKLYMPTATI
jgi:glucuronokinase